MSPVSSYAFLVYALPLVLVLVLYQRRVTRVERENLAALRESVEAGLTEPSSLHPVINANRCIGCGSCAKACPEAGVLGIIEGRAQMLSPTDCIGHGACRTACPADAITLVFGTERRGVDIPQLCANFETNVPGIFVAGELGGMGLIRNAIEQGRQAIDAVRPGSKGSGDSVLDVVIVGAGPAGFSASLASLAAGLRFVTVEQSCLGGTVAHYPRGKIVMNVPAYLPIVGKFRLREATKEALLDVWHRAESETGLKINYDERMESVTQVDEGFEVATSRASYRTRAILLALGRRGSPRRLGVPGEDLPKVVYGLVDPEQYRGLQVLVVGGGDSALEAAACVAGEPGTVTTLSYRSAAFSRAKQKNRRKVADAEASGRLRVLMGSTVTRIGSDDVGIEQDGKQIEISNDGVIVCAGGQLPTNLLKGFGIAFETKHGTP